MPGFKIPRDTIEGKPAIPPGVYKLRCDGFKPKLSGKRDSYNLNPILKVIEPEEYRDTTIFFNMNSNFGPGISDFVHSAGYELQQDPSDGGYLIPGDFGMVPLEDPTKWAPYTGPMLGAVLTVELVEVPSQVKDPTKPGEYKNDPTGKTKNVIKRFLGVEGDTYKYSDNIAGKDAA